MSRIKFKKIIKKWLGGIGFRLAASIYRLVKPKKKTTKPVAFLIGFSTWKHRHMTDYLSDYHVRFIDPSHSHMNHIAKIAHYRKKVIMVWGYEDNEKIRQYALKKNIPYYRVEDGFIRSVQLGADKAVPLSICIDTQALYYDATDRSDLEDILNTYDFKSDPKLMIRAKLCMKRLKELNISKYNHVSYKDVHTLYGEKTRRRVLVIGQVEDDQSIKRGCSKHLTNNDLVWIAAIENRDAEIIYKPHPDVLYGKRPGQTNPHDVNHIAKVVMEPLSLTDALETIDHVYTITSLSGFEALLRGIPVTTLGAPFYSGWGLTDDRQKVNRRTRKLTIADIFAAAYILYPKYLNPFTKQALSIEQAIELLGTLKELEGKRMIEQTEPLKQDAHSEYWDIPVERNAKIGILSTGIQSIPNIQSFLRGDAVFNPKNTNEVQAVAGWGMKPSAQKALAFSQEHQIPYISLEDGFIRSLGLGVEGSPPLSICIDHIGIYYDATRPSRLEYILNNSGWETEELINQARSAMEYLLQKRISKYNHAPLFDVNTFKNDESERILVADQTLGDMSISLGLANQSTFMEMYKAAREENPDAHIYIKAHPDVIAGKKQGNIDSNQMDKRTTFIYEDCNPLSLLEHVHKVYVVTSQLGFEALMLNKEVHCFGMPFYAGWEVTKDRIVCERRVKRRSVEELFAAAYLIYPRYIHPISGKPGTIFDVIHYLADESSVHTLTKGVNTTPKRTAPST